MLHSNLTLSLFYRYYSEIYDGISLLDIHSSAVLNMFYTSIWTKNSQ